MTQGTGFEVEASNVETAPSPPTKPTQKRARIGMRVMRFVTDWRDALVYTVRSRKLTEREIGRLHRDAVSDPAVERALERTLAARPQFQRKASTGGGVQGKSKR